LSALEIASLVIKKGRLRCFGRVEHTDDADCVKSYMTMEVDGTRQTGSPRKIWWNCDEEMLKSLGLEKESQDGNWLT